MKTLAILDTVGLPYDGNTLDSRALGGSESAVIRLGRELVKLDFQVTVFNNCLEYDSQPGVYDGVHYRPLAEAQQTSERFDIVICSRSTLPFMNPEYQGLMDHSGWRMLWMHDTFLWGDEHLESLTVTGRINEIITLTDWHTTYIQNCNHSQKRNMEMLKHHTFVFRNGAELYLDEVDLTAKDRDLFVYNASVSKGMGVLLDHVWPRIRESIPTARLRIIGGFYRFPDAHGPDEQEKKWITLREANHGRNGVEFTGLLTQRQIAHELAAATWFLYPTEFPETFGISTMEAQAYGCVPLTARFGGLEEVALDSGSFKLDYSVTPNVIFPHINTNEQVTKFVNMVLQAYHNPYVTQQKAWAAQAVRELASWADAAVVFKNHVYHQLGWYMPVDQGRRARRLTRRWQMLSGRRMTNPEEQVEIKMGQERRIAVVSPFRNAREYLRDHILSVASQDYGNWHHYLVDDASDDGSGDLIREVIRELPERLQDRFTVITNTHRRGAVGNQYQVIAHEIQDPDAIVALLDGDDFLMPRPDVFDRINREYADGAEFTYGSCWSMADNIPLVAQAYPRRVRESGTYREHRFNWGIPYTHLRTFRRGLIEQVDPSEWQFDNGEWYGAGGDVAVFYSLIERARPDGVRAITDMLVRYNDINPANDYKINSHEQNRTAAHITQRKPMKQKNLSDLIIAKSTEPQVKPQPTANRPKRILIAIPTARYIEVETFKSIYELEVPEGHQVDFQYFFGYTISHVRNIAANWLLQNGYDYMLAVDSDMVLPRDALVKMLAADKDMVSGIYIQRKPGEHRVEIYGVTPGGGRDNIPWNMLRGRGLVEVAGCGFGCVLIKRRVFEGIPYPQFEYHEAIPFEGLVSEDVDFCMKATNAGFTIWADTSILCGHLGKTAFEVETPDK